MLEYFAERLGAAIAGLILGMVIAATLFWWVELDAWWTLVAVPVVCCVVCALIGDRAIEWFKSIARFVLDWF